ncbi:class I SAM-dependent methyltransferase [Paenibacillus sp. 1001270B_150601_E10]|uniref:class I SAM-dependent methyltransferase n=1 Tax=Paenibacillus sp. 1001270B_150601_E10 TaxID=2787079 RepID=UPI0018A082A5|nr:class I SAM-dependent methyltransferase [Paenibacillus sp. 1001270B_150601_E10]
MIVTTGDSTSAEWIDHAQKLAKELGARYVVREGQSVPRMVKKYRDEDFLIIMNHSVRFVRVGQTDMTYHPSMAFIRAKRLLAGRSDGMIRASRVEADDIVLDCTAGLGSDSLVFSIAVGDKGHVIACESELSLYALVKAGLRHYESQVPEINEAMRRIEMRHGEHLDQLKQMEDKSVDIVYFDPMFREPVEESASIVPLRQVANHASLRMESIQEARRVARKTVVLKELRNSGEFERLGFDRVELSGSKLAYGVIDIADNN